jgi:hypothetical protein
MRYWKTSKKGKRLERHKARKNSGNMEDIVCLPYTDTHISEIITEGKPITHT